MAQTLRLNKFIAAHSQYSRRAVDELLAKGKITVAGTVATVGMKIDPDHLPVIKLNGKSIIEHDQTMTYVLLNKPKGCVVTRAHFLTERSVMTLLPSSLQHLRPVGRLDKHSTGLLLLTNDGEIINQFTHPRYEHDKEYIVTVKYPLKPDDITAWRRGVHLEEGFTGPNASVEQLDDNRFRIVLRQGWNRQIRRMVELRQNRVLELERIRLGQMVLDNLPLGKWKVIQRAAII
ncbi:MAG: pseudouridine synthase [Patescibacteria group bacterium]|jgi:pseudouridine synthase